MSERPKLVDLPLEPDGSGVMEALNDALEMAQGGSVSMVAVTIIERDGCATFIRSKVHNRSSLIGAMQRHQFRLLQESEDE